LLLNLFIPAGYRQACIAVYKVAASACKEKNRSASPTNPVYD